MELIVILKSGKELTTINYPKENFEDLRKAIFDGKVDFIAFHNKLNGSETIVRMEDISAILYAN